MSKSLNNFFTVREVAEQFGYEPIRYLMVSSHYRSPINYSVEILEQCKASLDRLYTCRENLEFTLENAASGEQPGDAALKELFNSRETQFINAMEDDLNTADAVTPTSVRQTHRLRRFVSMHWSCSIVCAACWACSMTERSNLWMKRLRV